MSLATATKEATGTQRRPSPKDIQAPSKDYVLVPVQQVLAKCKQGSINVFFDTSSNIQLVCTGFTKAAGWIGKPINQGIAATGGKTTKWETKLYSVTLIGCDGS